MPQPVPLSIGAVKNVVAGHVGPDPEMIVVGRVQNRLVLQAGIRPRKNCNHVIGFKRANLAGHARPEADMQRDGLEVARAGIGHHFVEVHAGRGSELARDVEMNPGGGLQLGRAVQLEVRMLSRVGIAHHPPAVAGHVRFVDENGADRALAGRFFVLVGPAAVVGQRLAVENLWVVGAAG